MPEIGASLPVLFLAAGLGYLAGSIPFGMLLARLLNLGDLRKIGSGNIGATNVLRTGNKGAAAATLALDALKAAVPVLVFRAWGEAPAQVAGLFAFLGHCFPVWLRFRGGKGVASFLGLMLALHWPAGLAACVTWLGAAWVSRISSVGALGAALLSPVLVVLLGHPDALLLTVLVAGLVWWRHSANISRLRTGTEPRIGRR